jgi:tripartite-type tricarboxylate transporter receptor subunit TctC
LALALAIFTAAAAEVDFYAGKNIQLLIGFSGGGCYEAYARLLAPISADIINVTLQIGLSRDKSLPHLPLIMELTQDARSKAALKVIVARQSMARPFAAPPGIPVQRARRLQSAFAATTRDPQFLADASSLNLEVEPVDGADVEMLLKELYSTPAEVLKLAGELVRD